MQLNKLISNVEKNRRGLSFQFIFGVLMLVLAACGEQKQSSKALTPHEREQLLDWALPWQPLTETPTVILRKQLQNALKRLPEIDAKQFVVVGKRKGRNDYLLRLDNEKYILLMNVGQEKLPLLHVPLKDLDEFSDIMAQSQDGKDNTSQPIPKA